MIFEVVLIGMLVIFVKVFDGDFGVNKVLMYWLENLNINYNNNSKISEFFIIS